tara:strand:+ start:220 stop:795 length:576 start_codon:yes stop_codon:yes gene_type:complete
MRIIGSKFSLILSILVFISNHAYAGNMKGWADLMISYMDQPLINTLNGMYRGQGIVLLDIGDNYAAYSFSAQQLTTDEKENISTVENSSNFVLRFNTCNADPNLTEKINMIAVKRSFEKVDDFNDNFYELVELAEEKKWIKNNYGKSNAKENQIFMLWAVNNSENNDTFIEIQINKEIHQLVWQMTKKCPQ